MALNLTLAEAAEVCGRSLPTMRAWVRAGLPATKAGRSWSISVSDLMVFVEARAASRSTPESPAGDWAAVRIRRATAQAALIEIELATRRGDAISIEAATAAWADCIKNFRDRMGAIPAAVAPELLGQQGELQVAGVLRREIEAALTDLADAGARQLAR